MLPKKIKFCLVLLISFLFLLIPEQPALADWPIGTTLDCNSAAQCQEKLGPGNWVCTQGACALAPGSSFTGSYLEKPYSDYVKDIDESLEKQEVSQDIFGASLMNSIGINWPILQVRGSCEPGQQICSLGGVLGTTSSLIAFLCSTPPASSIEYLADLGKSFGLASPAYAQQGIGFRYFTPILPIWKVTRNLAYLAFVIIFIVTGLAIMFRVKISPQAVLTIEAALPKIIIALILVTFSYAIAGFLIDLIYILTGLLTAALKPAGLPNNIAGAYSGNPSIGVMVQWFFGRGGDYAGILKNGIGNTIANIPILGNIPVIGSQIASGLAHLILLIALVFAFFKLFFSLLMVYINIILSIIISPLQIMLSAIPGREGNSFTDWLKGLLANILVFPAVIGAFLLAEIVALKTKDIITPIWSPPLLFAADAQFAGGLIAYGIMLISSQIPSYIKALFEPKAKVTPPGAAFLGGVAGGLTVGKVGYEKTIGDEVAAAKKAALERRVNIYRKGVEKEAGELTTMGKILSKF